MFAVAENGNHAAIIIQVILELKQNHYDIIIFLNRCGYFLFYWLLRCGFGYKIQLGIKIKTTYPQAQTLHIFKVLIINKL